MGMANLFVLYPGDGSEISSRFISGDAYLKPILYFVFFNLSHRQIKVTLVQHKYHLR